VLVMPIEEKGRHLDPKQIPPKDRVIQLVKFKFCSDINPQQTLEKAHNQHQPLIQRPRTRSLRGISRNNQVTLHVILLGVGGTIYNQYTITPLLNLGIPTHKVHQLATKLHCHAIKSLNKITKQDTKYTLTTTTVNTGDKEGGVLVERLASGCLGAGRIAWLTTRRILIINLLFLFFGFRWALASVSTRELFLNAHW